MGYTAESYLLSILDFSNCASPSVLSLWKQTAIGLFSRAHRKKGEWGRRKKETYSFRIELMRESSLRCFLLSLPFSFSFLYFFYPCLVCSENCLFSVSYFLPDEKFKASVNWDSVGCFWKAERLAHSYPRKIKVALGINFPSESERERENQCCLIAGSHFIPRIRACYSQLR